MNYLFKKHPSKEDFTNNDLEIYKNILELSNAYRKHYKSDGDMKGTRSKKNTNIILPLFQVSQGKGFASLRKKNIIKKYNFYKNFYKNFFEI